MQAPQFTGVWRKWQKEYNPEDPHSRTKFLAADVVRIEAKFTERAIKMKEAMAAGTLADQQQARATNTSATLDLIDATRGGDEDLESAQHEITQADEQGVPVTLRQQERTADREPISFNVACVGYAYGLWQLQVVLVQDTDLNATATFSALDTNGDGDSVWPFFSLSGHSFQYWWSVVFILNPVWIQSALDQLVGLGTHTSAVSLQS